MKLKRFELETFTGDIRMYPSFKNDFVEFIEPYYSDSELAFILKKHLSPSVQDEVHNVLSSYSKMWSRLDQKFGNVSLLVDSILYDIKKLSPNNARGEEVLKMIHVVEKAHRDLEQLGLPEELYNNTTISMIEKL